MRIVASTAAVLALFALFAGGRQLFLTETGARATATVKHCEFPRSGKPSWTECAGSWTLAGRTADGTIVNADIEESRRKPRMR